MFKFTMEYLTVFHPVRAHPSVFWHLQRLLVLDHLYTFHSLHIPVWVFFLHIIVFCLNSAGFHDLILFGIHQQGQGCAFNTMLVSADS